MRHFFVFRRVIFIALSTVWMGVLPAPCLAIAELQIQSGFQPGVYTQDNVQLQGTDNTATPGTNSWDNIASYVDWIKMPPMEYYQGGQLDIVDDPTNPGVGNKVMRFDNTDWQTHDLSRSQVAFWQGTSWGDSSSTPNQFDQQFYSYDLYLPQETHDLWSYREGIETWEWYMLWESHSNGNPLYDNTRHQIGINKRANTDDWHFRITQEIPEGTIQWENTGAYQDVAVPFGEWFTLDVFFKFHETDGQFFVAITPKEGPNAGERQIVADYEGKTQYIPGTKLWDQEVLKMYHHREFTKRAHAAGDAGTYQLYDNFEMWSDFPAGYFDPADYDGNGTVGPEDYFVWRAAFGSNVTPGTGADGNSDGIVDAADYNVWRDSLDAAGTAPGVAVPSPSGFSLIGCVLLGLGASRRRR